MLEGTEGYNAKAFRAMAFPHLAVAYSRSRKTKTSSSLVCNTSSMLKYQRYHTKATILKIGIR